MHESQWFYVRESKRTGPLGLSAMREMLARGELGAQTMVWTVGMNQWTPAAQVPALSGQAHAAPPPAVAPIAAQHPLDSAGNPAPVAASAPGTAPIPADHHEAAPVAALASGIGYHSATAGMPQRATENLKGHAHPAGDQGDWPLDDARVAHFAETVQVRKKITGAAQLYRALLFLSLIGLVMLGIVFAAALADPPRGSGARGDTIAMGVAAVFLLGLCALYYVTWRATMRAHRWAPLTMMIVFLLGVVANLISLTGAFTGRVEPAALVGGLVGTALAVLFAFISLQSLLSIPKYLAQPAWCQELIVKAGL
jgi:uncharacterized membrane protein